MCPSTDDVAMTRARTGGLPCWHCERTVAASASRPGQRVGASSGRDEWRFGCHGPVKPSEPRHRAVRERKATLVGLAS